MKPPLNAVDTFVDAIKNPQVGQNLDVLFRRAVLQVIEEQKLQPLIAPTLDNPFP